jgi:hypothetical protein
LSGIHIAIVWPQSQIAPTGGTIALTTVIELRNMADEAPRCSIVFYPMVLMRIDVVTLISGLALRE